METFRSGKKKRKKGYTLVEVIVSLAVIGVVITMFFNALIISLKVTYRALGRSFVRENISEVANLITRDIRNSDTILSCGQQGVQNSCEVSLATQTYKWELCDGNRVCKSVLGPSGYERIFITTDTIDFTYFTFEQGYSDVGESISRGNVIITISADHVNEALKVKNVIRQVSVSSRNYEVLKK